MAEVPLLSIVHCKWIGEVPQVVDTNVPCTLLFQAYDLTGQIIVGSMLI
jgi:hypothetical protein